MYPALPRHRSQEFHDAGCRADHPLAAALIPQRVGSTPTSAVGSTTPPNVGVALAYWPVLCRSDNDSEDLEFDDGSGLDASLSDEDALVDPGVLGISGFQPWGGDE